MNKVIYLYILCVVLFACKPENNNQFDLKSNPLILDSSKPSKINASSIFSSLSFLALEKMEDKIIGNISKIICKDSILFIKTRNSIFAYNLKGEYLFDISNKGEAPEQYRTISDFDVNDNIEIMDHFSKKIHVYTKDGKLKSSWKYPLFAISFKNMKDGNYVFYSGNTPNLDNNYMFHVYSKEKNKLIKSFVDINKKVINYFQYMDIDNFPQFEGQKIFMSGSKMVYKYDRGGIFPAREINLKEFEIPKEVYNKSFEDVSYFDKYLEKKDYLSAQNTFYLENKNNTIIPLSRKVKEKLWLWENKTLKQTKLINSLSDDFNFENHISYEIKDLSTVGIDQKNMYFWKDSAEFLDIIKRLRLKIGEENFRTFMDSHENIKKISSSTSIGSNPIIIMSEIL